MSRIAKIRRTTRETEIETSINLDGRQLLNIETGLGFFDHMLNAMAFHAGWDISLKCDGDLHIDDHHTIEDCGLTLGQALHNALGEKIGIARFGSCYAPLDESLARAVVDFSGRPFCVVDLGLKRDSIGNVACENLSHFFQSFAMAGKFTLHVDVLRGENDHHRAEAAYKATALALRQAVTVCSDKLLVPSTKGVL